MDKTVKVELTCQELDIIQSSLVFMVIHGGRGFEKLIEKIGGIIEKECKD